MEAQVSKESEQTNTRRKDNSHKRTSLLIDVSKDLRGVRLLGQSCKGSRGAKNGRVTDANNGDEDDGVHDTREDSGAGLFDGNDERAGAGVGDAGATHETAVVGGNQQTDEHEGDDVEDGDTPKDLLDRGGKRLAGVGSLGSSKTDQLGTGKRERGGDKDATETLEAIIEGPRIAPIHAADIAAFGFTADVNYDSEEAIEVRCRVPDATWVEHT